MIVKNNPEEYITREDLLQGSHLSYEEKKSSMKCENSIDYDREVFDEKGYSVICKKEED